MPNGIPRADFDVLPRTLSLLSRRTKSWLEGEGFGQVAVSEWSGRSSILNDHIRQRQQAHATQICLTWHAWRPDESFDEVRYDADLSPQASTFRMRLTLLILVVSEPRLPRDSYQEVWRFATAIWYMIMDSEWLGIEDQAGLEVISDQVEVGTLAAREAEDEKTAGIEIRVPVVLDVTGRGMVTDPGSLEVHIGVEPLVGPAAIKDYSVNRITRAPRDDNTGGDSTS